MEIHNKLAKLSQLVGEARAMPMSASCIVNRAEILGLVTDIERLLPEDLSRARAVLSDRHQVIDLGRQEAERLAEQARAEQARLVSRTEVSREAEEEAARIVDAARREADATRVEIDEYVDAKLANFEVVLLKTMQTVTRGRERMRGLREEDALAELEDGLAPGA